jgi:hypothetical protein
MEVEESFEELELELQQRRAEAERLNNGKGIWSGEYRIAFSRYCDTLRSLGTKKKANKV